MAPFRPAARWRRTGSLGRRGEDVSSVGFRNKKVKQRTWRPNPAQAFVGSVSEGQGFALRRKLKIQQNYRKLQWKGKKAQSSQESQFTDRYPDHLKHLYLAEEKRLRKKVRKVDQSVSEEQNNQTLPEEQCDFDQTLSEEHCTTDQPEACTSEPEEDSEELNFSTIPKKNKKKTSNQKAQEEYEQIQAKRAAKKQEFEKRKQEREEAQRQYKKKKMEMYKILSKKTKKGQPNLNLQMEYLLKKIQEKN